MDTSDLKIVCYTGGTCGDIITAIIHPDNVEFNLLNKTVRHDSQRELLKKPHVFASDDEKDLYINEIGQKYRSIPSHDLEYHIKRNHKFISISVQDFDTALWAAKRFKQCHRPHVWVEMQKVCGANSIEEYAQKLIDFSNMVTQHTHDILKLEDIVAGRVLPDLEKILGYDLKKNHKNVYQNWLDIQSNTFFI